jgi:hypothetical protein
MSSSTDAFTMTWRVPGTCGEVADVLRYPLDLPRWWPAVCLAADELAPPDDRGLHQRVALLAKGWLPWTRRWELEVAESRYPERLVLALRGGLEGRAVWTFAQDGAFVDVTCEWHVNAATDTPQALAGPARALFAANLRWAMRQGEESLRLELLRRRATTVDAAAAAQGPAPAPGTGRSLARADGT